MRTAQVNWSNWPGISVVHCGSKPPKTRTGRIPQTPKFHTLHYNIILERTHKRDSRGKKSPETNSEKYKLVTFWPVGMGT